MPEENSLTEPDAATVDATTPDVEKWVSAIVLKAIEIGASDIHIEPMMSALGENSRVLIRCRVDGVLTPVFTVPWAYRAALMAKIKIMTNEMNITERRTPQSGAIRLVALGRQIDLQVEILPTVHGESCVMRLPSATAENEPVGLGDLGFLPDTLSRVLALLKILPGRRHGGLILVCGPAQAGKSTMLHAAVSQLNRSELKVLSAESPVGRVLEGVIQVPVNPELSLGEGEKFDFSAALRRFLRVDSDVIAVSEIRDSETAQLAVKAATSARVVLSAIQGHDSASALARLSGLGVEAFAVASVVRAVLALRLARLLCKDCKRQRQATPEEHGAFKRFAVALAPAATLCGPPEGGCPSCRHRGFKGSLGLQELLLLDEDLRAAFLREGAADSLRAAFRARGARSLAQDGLEKVKLGLTTVDEVFAALG